MTISIGDDSLSILSTARVVGRGRPGVINTAGAPDSYTLYLDFLGSASTIALGAPLASKTFDQVVDFTRTTAATYFDSAGVLRVTPASKNLLTYTQEFDNAAWAKAGVTVSANAATTPDNTLTADRLTATGANGTALQTYTATAVPYTYSVWLRRVTGTGNVQITVDGTTYVTVSVTSTFTRFETTLTPSAGSRTAGVRLVASGDVVEVWGAQLELGSTATAYTRNAGGVYPARFDYDPVTLAPRGLLVEEQRTNLLVRSEEFENAAWTKSRATVTANATTSPDGTVDADKLVEDTTASATHRVYQNASKAASSRTRTFSVFLKAAERTFAQVRVADNTEAVSAITNIDLSAGTASAASVSGGSSISAASARISPVGNGWYRVALTATFDATITGPGAFVFICNSLGGPTYTGDGTSGIFVWGAQWEDGSFATSYIPTAASQVTRTADVATITGANFSSFYNQSEGTFVVEWDGFKPTTASGTPTVFQAGNATDSFIDAILAGGNYLARTFVGGVSQAEFSPSYVPNATEKFATAYKANDFAFSRNGATASVDTSGSVPTNLDRIGLGVTRTGTNALNGHIRRIRYYPRRESDSALVSLST